MRWRGRGRAAVAHRCARSRRRPATTARRAFAAASSCLGRSRRAPRRSSRARRRSSSARRERARRAGIAPRARRSSRRRLRARSPSVVRPSDPLPDPRGYHPPLSRMRRPRPGPVCERSYTPRVPGGRKKTMLFGKLLPREGNFFELFNQHGAHIAEGARAFIRLIQHYPDVELRDKHASEVGHAERQADKITAEVNRLLHKTFITPIDREQIHGLINAMDDILDLLQDASETMTLYDVQAMNDDILRLGDLSAKCCQRVQHAITLLPKINDHDTAVAALKTCEEIDKL